MLTLRVSMYTSDNTVRSKQVTAFSFTTQEAGNNDNLQNRLSSNPNFEIYSEVCDHQII